MTGRFRMAAAGLVAALCLAMPLVPSSAGAQQDKTILFGQTASLTGQHEGLGRPYRAGILAAFRARNRAGGVGGRQIRLVSLDDGYEPPRAEANARKFVEEDKVLAVIGGVGTPTSIRVAPLLQNAGIPFVGPLTGASFLHDMEMMPNVINLRAGYRREVEAHVRYQVNAEGARRFGVVYQDDAFGYSVLKDYQSVLAKRGIKLLASSAFSRNSHAVHSSVFEIQRADLDSVLLIGSYQIAAEFMELSGHLDSKYAVMALSFAASSIVEELVGHFSPHFHVTEVVPEPEGSDLKIVASFRDAARAAGMDPKTISTVSLEGYILGRYVIEVLRRMGPDISRKAFLRTGLEQQPFVLDDWTIEFAPGSNVGSRYVEISRKHGSQH